jgi:hypothetical protein
MSLEGRSIALVEDDPIMGESLVDRLTLEGASVRWSKGCKGRTNSRPLWRSKTRPVAAGSLNDEGARSGPFIVRRRS